MHYRWHSCVNDNAILCTFFGLECYDTGMVTQSQSFNNTCFITTSNWPSRAWSQGAMLPLYTVENCQHFLQLHQNLDWQAEGNQVGSGILKCEHKLGWEKSRAHFPFPPLSGKHTIFLHGKIAIMILYLDNQAIFNNQRSFLIRENKKSVNQDGGWC